MKSFFLSAALLIGVSAHAQFLPVPGAENPDWTLERSEAPPAPSQFMRPLGTDPMPNALQKSISSSGNRHYHWDGNRQLAYMWLSDSNTACSVAPDKRVTVREERTGTVYVYRRRGR